MQCTAVEIDKNMRCAFAAAAALAAATLAADALLHC